MIKLEKGKCYENRTKKYLSIILLECPDWIKSYLLRTNPMKQLVNINGIFRDDTEYRNATGDTNPYLLFVVVDINGEYLHTMNKYRSIENGRVEFRNFLKLFEQNKKWGRYNYVFDSNLYGSHRHVFVLNIKEWAKSVDEFDGGNYSKMFTLPELKKLKVYKMDGKVPNSLYQTLTADPEAKYLFKARVEKEFGTILGDVDVEKVVELDIPSSPKMEVLNFDKHK